MPDIITLIDEERKSFITSNYKHPNAILLGKQEWIQLCRHPEFPIYISKDYDKIYGMKIYRVIDENCLSICFM